MVLKRDLGLHFDACSINTATLGFRLGIHDSIELIARQGYKRFAPWRREVEGHDIAGIARHANDAGLSLSGYCRSTFIPAATDAQFRANVADNKKAIADAATLRAPVFVMVVGGLPEGSRDIASARRQVQDACGELKDFGRKVGVRIGLEPLHPVYAADRSCLNMLSQALDICDSLEGEQDDPWLGVIIDCYHVWWDPDLKQGISRAGRDRRIMGFHVCDWLVPTLDVLNDRGMMGDGIIDISGIRADIEATGYDGAVEVEIFSSENWWRRVPSETLAVCAERLRTI